MNNVHGMFTPWTMNSSQGPVKFVIGCWTCPGTTSVYTKEKKCQCNHEFEVPNIHILRPILSTDMVQRALPWERQKRCFGRKRQGPMAKKLLLSKKFNDFFLRGKRRWIQEKTKYSSNSTFFFFKTALFGQILNKNQHMYFLVHSHSSWSTFGLHLVRGPKNSVNCLF